MSHDDDHPPRRVRVTVRDRRVYLDADDVAGLLRDRARCYRDHADALVAAATDPDTPIDPEGGAPVPVLEEALACRMVAEELEQRADVLDGIGR